MLFVLYINVLSYFCFIALKVHQKNLIPHHKNNKLLYSSKKIVYEQNVITCYLFFDNRNILVDEDKF